MKLDLNDSQLLYICFAGIIFTFILENIYPYHSLTPACNRRVKTKKWSPACTNIGKVSQVEYGTVYNYMTYLNFMTIIIIIASCPIIPRNPESANQTQ